MKRSLWEKRIPTILAFLLILVSIFATPYLLRDRVLNIGGASSDSSPRNIQIVNITDTSFSVFFTTQKESISALNIEGQNLLDTIVYDKRDTNHKQAPYYSHFITVDNLKPQTAYTFSIISGGETFFDKDNKKFEIVTGSILADSTFKENFFSGKILLPDGSPASDTIVYITADGGKIIATLTDSQGTFSMSTTAVRNITLDDYYNFQPNTEINIYALRQTMQSSVKTTFKDASSIPTITLLQNYNFVNIVSEQQYATESKLLIPTPAVKVGDIKILIPKGNDFFVDQKPAFSGTAPPNQKVKIIIQSSHQIETEVVTDANGFWSFRPNAPLAPGIHKITIETGDSLGTIKRITQTFNIFSSGSQVFQTATPSATPPLRLTPTNTPTIAIALSPTPSPTFMATLAPSPSPTIPPPPPTVSPPGNTVSTIILTFISLLFIATGATIFFLIA